MRPFWVVVLGVAAGWTVGAAEAPDVPLEGIPEAPFISGSRTGWVSAAVVDRRLRVVWGARGTGEAGAALVSGSGSSDAQRKGPRLMVSTDAPGHWSVRDWRSWGMGDGPDGWEARVPLQSALVPVVYFVEDVVEGRTNQSPMRCFRPRLAGVTEPTLVGNGHLDGFEQGLAGWEWGGSGNGAEWMSLSTNAWSGRASLRVEVPAGRGAATVGTVRVRGWMLEEWVPKALAMTVRMEEGQGRIRLALHGHARTPGLAVYPHRADWEVGPRWQRLEVPLDGFVHLRGATVDWFTVQFLAEAGRAVLLDDLELVLR